MTLSAEAYYDAEGPADQEPRTSQESGCRLLLVALLEDLFYVKTHQRRNKVSMKQYQRDRRWVMSESRLPFSFIWTCTRLRLDPAAVRQAFLADRHTTLGERGRRTAEEVA